VTNGGRPCSARDAATFSPQLRAACLIRHPACPARAGQGHRAARPPPAGRRHGVATVDSRRRQQLPAPHRRADRVTRRRHRRRRPRVPVCPSRRASRRAARQRDLRPRPPGLTSPSPSPDCSAGAAGGTASGPPAPVGAGSGNGDRR
jgi:hypothetical protein